LDGTLWSKSYEKEEGNKNKREREEKKKVDTLLGEIGLRELKKEQHPNKLRITVITFISGSYV